MMQQTVTVSSDGDTIVRIVDGQLHAQSCGDSVIRTTSSPSGTGFTGVLLLEFAYFATSMKRATLAIASASRSVYFYSVNLSSSSSVISSTRTATDNASTRQNHQPPLHLIHAQSLSTNDSLTIKSLSFASSLDADSSFQLWGDNASPLDGADAALVALLSDGSFLALDSFDLWLFARNSLSHLDSSKGTSHPLKSTPSTLTSCISPSSTLEKARASGSSKWQDVLSTVARTVTPLAPDSDFHTYIPQCSDRIYSSSSPGFASICCPRKRSLSCPPRSGKQRVARLRPSLIRSKRRRFRPHYCVCRQNCYSCCWKPLLLYKIHVRLHKYESNLRNRAPATTRTRRSPLRQHRLNLS
ncbi:hypothetical protein BC830DRAFT_616658 [Chytriomyces sp. MP71]|nr:hypothetical protein BC830DRAFT_616658 [Chytriomyces sp. MP71]